MEDEIASDDETPISDEAYLRALAALLSEWDTPEDAAAFDDR